MRLGNFLIPLLLLFLVSIPCKPVFAQLGFQIDIPKPKLYENRVLKAEKTGDKKLKNSKRFFQNLTTHYNYFFNASNKLNEVIDKAKSMHKDDYTTLLSFYNYSLDATQQDKVQLDSVIYKSQTGIVNHDLRNDWIDNMYLLWGAAYYLQKKFDSASLMFQFINYSFAEKEKDGYYKYIGSHMDGSNDLTISTREKSSFVKNIVSRPPSRNDAFIWQIRTLIEVGNLAQAGSMIATLKNDPLFPERLRDDLEEVQAYWYYRQNILDSSATHLEKALSQAQTKQEKARWEYLAAQMFEKSGATDEAQKLYNRAISHTTDPVMDIYARLNLVRINKSGGENYIDQNIAELVKMARKDRYEEYRDVIYYMAAQMEMERNNFTAAQVLLEKSAKYNNGNFASRNNAYLLIADLLFDQKKYLQAASFYDSIQAVGRDDNSITQRIQDRKILLSKIVHYSSIISRQDSLQHIAAMPEQERTVFLTRLAKQLRKQQGLLDENASPTSGNPLVANAATDLFNNQSKGEWYFYNPTLKSQGSIQFKQNWGNRPNVDNWRRFADVNQQLLSKTPNNTRPGENAVALASDNTPTFNSLLESLPVSDAKLRISNDSIRNALFDLGVAYMNDLEDYASSIETFENLRKRFPDETRMDEVLFNLYYSYNKSGNIAKSDEIKNLLLQKYPASHFSTIAGTGKDPVAMSKVSPEATKDYENIYDLFIEGNFEEAEAAKKKADSTYRTNHWQPQLLYIEAVYHIRQRQDSVAKNILQTLIAQDPNSALAKKAQNLVSVLGRRRQIEDELTRLQIERPKEDSVVNQQPAIAIRPPAKRDSITTKTKPDVVSNSVPKKPGDTTTKKQLVQPKPASFYQFDPARKHYVMIILDKVDPVFVNEAKNAFTKYDQEKFYNQPLTVTIADLDADHKLLLIGDFPNAQAALDYILPTKRLAGNEIVPWLKPDKYSFSIMTDSNLEVLKNQKDLNLYKKFLDQNLPGKF